MTPHPIALFLTAALSWPTPVMAQEPVRVAEPPPPPAATAQGAPAQTAAAAVPGGAVPQGPQSPADLIGPPPPPDPQQAQLRIQKIQQVMLDRRPSTILRVWAAPEDAKPEAGKENAAAPGTTPQPGGAVTAARADPRPPAVSVATGRLLQPSTIVRSSSGMVVLPGPDGQPMIVPAGAEPMPMAPDGQPVRSSDPFDRALAAWSRNVTLGQWGEVKKFLAGLETEAEKKAAYQKLVTGLAAPPGLQPNQPTPPGMEQHEISFDDLMGIATAAPLPPDDAALKAMGILLRVSLNRGNQVEALVQLLQTETARPEGERPLDRRQAAKLLIGASLAVEAGEFLPDLAEASAQKDHEALNLLAVHQLAQHQKDPKKKEFLEAAWAALQAIFASSEIEQAQKEEALKAAVGLAPKLRAELGQVWLDASFAKEPQRGMDIIATIGVAAAQGLQQRAGDPAFRQHTLELANTAVEALLKAAPERALEWRRQLGLLAQNWLTEAQNSYRYDPSTRFGPMMRRDRFGNFFYLDNDSEQPSGPAVKVASLLDIEPSKRWLALLDDSLRPRFAVVVAQLWLKVQEETRAFPHIAELARTHPRQAKELCDEFLRVWTKNNNPNSQRDASNYFFYGYETRAQGIPLTRSRQERNLRDLAKWVAKLRELPVDELNEDLLTRAFTACHSSAEVYRMDAIETVFGSVAGLKPRTLAGLAQQMRSNLAGLWRAPAVQENAKTRRKQKDIEAEVLRGYALAKATVEGALRRQGDEWSLVLAAATLANDENNFRAELGRSSEFAGRRLDAFGDFERAADLYAGTVGKIPEEEETTQAYEHWFYAGLGASDLAGVKPEMVPVLPVFQQIRAHLQALPGEAAERHIGKFANTLFTRMGGANPAVKYRYLSAGFDIVGDHKLAHEARKVFDYYKDLVTEIELETVVDGSDTVGHERPFGVFVNLRHTREIERESGGFSRYLQNQNNVNYAYNYGRPTENYRDKFQESAQQLLAEHFHVLSVTFQSDKVNSRALPKYGWRVTPYAYLLLKPKGPQVDKIPALRLDLDFLDTSGYAVLPIQSPAVPIDASSTRGESRPVARLEITQILDEREAAQGKLKLEVKATGHGLIPDLDEVLALAPADFVQKDVEDTGVAVSRFDPDAEENVVACERTWTISYVAREGLEKLPTKFKFGSSLLPEAKSLYQRYADADLVAVAEEVELMADYGKPKSDWPWIAGGGGGLLMLVLVVFFLLRRRGPDGEALGLQMPAHVSPFTVLGLLRTIHHENGLDERSQQELAETIERLEVGYFAATGERDTDLRTVAETWIQRCQQRRSAG